VLQQQARFDAFFERYNHERAQEAPAIQVLRAVYSPSPRPYRGLPDLAYPLHDWIATVTQLRADLLIGRKINLSQVFAGQKVGIREVDEQIWLVSFMHYDLGFFDQEIGRVECAPNPFGAKVSPMSPE